MAEVEFPDRSGVPVPFADGEFDSERAALIAAETDAWPDDQRAAMLASLRAAEVRAVAKTRYRHPADIARAVDPNFVLTPALDLISSSIERVLDSPRKINLAITMPPQEGKSTTAAVWTPIRALQKNPNRRIILSTYADALAEAHSRAARNIISTYGAGLVDSLTGLAIEDKIGLKLAQGANKVSAWSVEGGAGGLVAAGIGSTITGLPADLFIIDDPFKNMMEADSAAHRNRVETWFSSVALTRLAPDASVILIQTRWHPEDLAGKVFAGEKLLPKHERTWRFLNIPAIAEEGIPDALGREPGEPMVSARDTPEAKRDFPTTRRQVGERTWYALYQGSPRNPAGGIFQRAWFDPRLPEPPLYPVASIVGVDPADSGEGDEAGIIGGMLMGDGRVALTHDRSGQFTADQWSREAVLLALEIGAREVAVESYTTSTTYVAVVKRAYQAIHRDAVQKAHAGAALTPVEQRALNDIPPFMVTKWRGPSKADAVARSGSLSQALETGKCRTVEFSMRVFEEQAADWQPGQHQPDRVAAAVITHDKLAALAGGGMHLASPIDAQTSVVGVSPPAYLRRKIG
ncbi:terminase [Mycobacterium phage Indlovu]|nr:terminase [Mycobacterium phage Indlovu]